VHRDIANDAGKRCTDVVVGELLPLGVGEGSVGLVVGFGILIGLQGLIVSVT